MIHYNVWFALRNTTAESEGLQAITAFLSDLHAANAIASFRLLKNSSPAPKTKMLPFQAQIEFTTDAQFAKAFSDQAARGIHIGLHGHVLSVVSDFQIEVFREILSSQPAEPLQYACEI